MPQISSLYGVKIAAMQLQIYTIYLSLRQQVSLRAGTSIIFYRPKNYVANWTCSWPVFFPGRHN